MSEKFLFRHYHQTFTEVIILTNLFISRILQSYILIILSIIGVSAQNVVQSSNEVRQESYLNFDSLVKGGRVRPHWMNDGNSFWFADGTPDNTIFYKVNPKTKSKTPLFDAVRLRQSLVPLLGEELRTQGLPFSDFSFVDDEKKIRFTVNNKDFLLNLKDYKITALLPQSIVSRNNSESGTTRIFSANKQQFVFTKNNNLRLGRTSQEDTEPLTVDGIKDYYWNLSSRAWSPDGKKLFVSKTDTRSVHRLPIINYSNPIEVMEWSIYAKSGEAIEKSELYVLDVQSKQAVRIKIDGGETDHYLFLVGWLLDNSEVIFLKMDRQGKRLDLMAANPSTGECRIILTEQQQTFVGGTDFIYDNWARQFTLLKEQKQFIWMSERDGWKHLYLYDLNGKLVRRLTEGSFPVIRVVATDETAGWIYFTANAESRLYDTNLYRVNFEGKGFKKLTEGKGKHRIQFSPSREYFLDTYSTPVDTPIVELRNANGQFLQQISVANIENLKKVGWNPPEEFIVKADDGKTDLYGILYKPFDFDPNKKYPVVEFIYAGPWITSVPHEFLVDNGFPYHAQSFAQLGFITFIVDGRGTPERSKAFQDVIYGNIGKYEIPDHVATLKQLAEKRPYMDLNRVGINGASWGGYFVIRAMLTAPEVYKVGVASSPGDLTEGAEINEPYMGLPKNNKEGYDYGSNPKLARNLKGKLLLIHGTSDANAPFSVTARMIEALIQEGKPYDLVIFPQQGHGFRGISGKYWLNVTRRYFEDNLKP